MNVRTGIRLAAKERKESRAAKPPSNFHHDGYEEHEENASLVANNNY
jgi:hypothetical protein